MKVIENIKSILTQSKRVWQLLRKPSSEEFRTIAKISALGILAIGLVGFVIADGVRIISRMFS